MAPHMPIFTFVLKLHMYQLIYFCSFFSKSHIIVCTYSREINLYILLYIELGYCKITVQIIAHMYQFISCIDINYC